VVDPFFPSQDSFNKESLVAGSICVVVVLRCGVVVSIDLNGDLITGDGTEQLRK
jgi:hypothetical protein